jgi:hypothetical protein
MREARAESRRGRSYCSTITFHGHDNSTPCSQGGQDEFPRMSVVLTIVQGSGRFAEPHDFRDVDYCQEMVRDVRLS